METTDSLDDFCVNCCQPVYSDTLLTDFQIKINISESLVSIYKLNYLNLLFDSGSDWNSNGNIKLCNDCFEVFSHLHKFYEDFNQLRTLESLLAKEIQRLDSCIQGQQVTRKIKIEPTLNVNQGQLQLRPKDISHRSSSRSIPLRKEESNKNLIVNVKRLEKDPIAQAAISNLKINQFADKPKVQIQENVTPNFSPEVPNYDDEKDEEEDDDNDDDNDDDDVDISMPEDDGSNSEEDELNNSRNKSSSKTKRKYVRKKPFQKKSEAEKKPYKPDTEKIRQRRKIEVTYRRRKTKYPNPCWHCDLYFDTQSQCYSHTLDVHFKPGNIICEKCARLSASKVSHSCHLNSCDSLKPGELLPTFKCELCEKDGLQSREYRAKDDYTAHLKSHKWKEIISCTVEGCKYQTKNPYALKFHVSTRHEGKPTKDKIVEPVPCPECGKICKNKYALRVHVKIHPKDEEGFVKFMQQRKRGIELQRERRRKVQASRTTVCDLCNIEMYTFPALINHKRDFHGETGNRKLVCEQCGKSFQKSHNLKHHIEFVHTESRNFYCDACGKSFKRNSNLGEHYRRAHTEEGRLKFNASMRLRNQRKKARLEAIAQLKFLEQHPESTTSDNAQSSSQLDTQQNNNNSTMDYYNDMTSNSSTSNTNMSDHMSTTTATTANSGENLHFSLRFN